MTYSLDFRRRVFELKEKEGLTFEQTSQKFAIGIKTLFRWQKCLEPCTKRQKPATKIDMEALKRDVIEHPDDYQWERAERFKVSESAIRYALKRLKVTYKKKPESSESERTGTYYFSE
jgi:transposase